MLDGWLAEHPEARLVVVDTLARFRPRRREASYDTDYAAVAALAELAAKHEVAIVIVHHDRKADADDFIDTVSGRLGLAAAAADSILVLRRERGAADATLYVTGRDIEEQVHALRFEQRTATWTLLGDAEQFRRSKERADVIRHLEGLGNEASPKEIAKALDKGYSTTRWLLRDMAKRGEIANPSRGQYTTNIANKPTNGAAGLTPQGEDGDADVGGADGEHQQRGPTNKHERESLDAARDSEADVGMLAMLVEDEGTRAAAPAMVEEPWQ